MSFLTSKTFWADATERAVKTAAQAEILAIGASQGFNLFTLDYKVAIGALLGGAFLSLLTSLASGGSGDTDSASLVVETKELK